LKNFENFEKIENEEQFNRETILTFLNPNSSSDNNIFGNNLDPSRQLSNVEMESKSLTDPIKFSDNPSLQHNETSSGITGGHGVVKRVLARVFGKLRQDTNCQMVTRSDI